MRGESAFLLAVITVLFAAPVLVRDNPILFTLLIVAFSVAIVTSNWNLLFGYAGVWSFGQLGFFAIGAYSSALLSLSGASPWIGMVVGVAICLAVALPITLVTFRLRATYFALATLGLQEVVRGFIVMIYPGIIFAIPALSIGSFSFKMYEGAPYYYLFLVVLLLSLLVHRRLLASKIGLAIMALRDSEIRAISLGVDLFKVRVIPLLVSVAFTSVAGSIYAHYTTSISQAIVGYDQLLTYTIILAFGGIGTFYGPVVASFIWTFLDSLLRTYTPEWRLVIMGPLVVITLLYSRTGLTGLYHRLVARLFAKS